MHEGEVVVSPGLAAQLVAGQFPQWAGLSLRPLAAAGSENVMLRMGAGLVLRFPRVAGAVAALGVETRWLGWVAGVLPLAVPEVVAEGRPGPGYPFPWAVLRWIEGQDALLAPVGDLPAAQALAGVVAVLRGQRVPEGVPVKAGDLGSRDGFLRRMVGRMKDEADPALVLHLWEQALDLPAWTGEPVRSMPTCIR